MVVHKAVRRIRPLPLGEERLVMVMGSSPTRQPLPPLRGKVGMGGMDKIRARELRKNLTEAERSFRGAFDFDKLEAVNFADSN